MEVTLNNDQNLFVIQSGASVSCMGFDVVFKQAQELARRIAAAGRKALTPQPEEKGTLTQYEQYTLLLSEYRTLGDKETWFEADVPPMVRKTLERYRKSGDEIRIFYGDESGRDWLEEFDMVGTIGRSTGPMRVPLLVPRGECGGPALLTKNIIRMMDVATGAELYRHPTYHQPELRLRDADEDLQEKGYLVSVEARNKYDEWQIQANFKTLGDAGHWLAFMTGKVFVGCSEG